MARRALTVGSATGGLAGVVNDVDVMGALLDQRGFAVRRCVGADATRAGILAAYEELIRDTEPGDVSFVYYSGHGGLARPVTHDAGQSPDLQFIVPTDIGESSPSDFRGILAAELSVLLARLIARSDNAVVMLDCCHAAHMSRDPDLRPRALPRITHIDVAEHAERILESGLDVDLLHPLGNRTAVRLVACAPHESAYEHANRSGVTLGIFTESLQTALEEAGTLPVTWTILMRRIRDRVLAVSPGQRPEVEGDESARLLFDTVRADAAGAVPIVASAPGRATIPGGRLLRISVGDQFTVMPPGAVATDDAAAIATATVDRLAGAAAQAAVVLRPGHERVPLGAQGFPARLAAARRAVALSGDGPALAGVRAALESSALVRPAEPAEDVVLAEVVVTADGVVVRDPAGPVTGPIDAQHVAGVVTAVEKLSRVATVQGLAPEPGAELDAGFDVEWGRVTGGTAVPLPPAGEVVHAGESVYVRLRNDSDRRLFFHLFDVGVSGAMSLLTDSDPSGLPLRPGREETIGRTELGGLEGLGLLWPDGVPAGTPRPESFLVIVTSAPQDLSVLQQEAIGDQAREILEDVARNGTVLEQMLAQAALGGTRDVDRARIAAPLHFALRRIDFHLSAGPAPVREGAPFLVDERPSPSLRLRRARTRAPERVAVRLTDLLVHRGRAFPGPALRIDALVLTGEDGDEPVYRAQTARAGVVGDRFPVDDMIVFEGLAAGSLDIALWLSHDRNGGPSLSDLLGRSAGTVAVLVNRAQALLSQAASDCIALYRASFLADEGFGIGRHPHRGTLRVRDFSLSYRIDRAA